MIKKYLDFINEGVLDYLKPNSQEEIEQKLKSLSPNEQLIISTKYNYLTGIKNALERGADISYDDYKAIVIAGKKGRIDIIEYLLSDNPCDSNAIDRLIDGIIEDYNRNNIIEYILDKCYDDDLLFHLIREACYHHNDELLEKLLNHKNIDKIDLSYILEEIVRMTYNEECIEQLLKHGVKVEDDYTIDMAKTDEIKKLLLKYYEEED